MTELTIAQQVAAMGAPGAEAFAREQAELDAREVVVPTGAALPDAELIDPHGKSTSLYGATNGKPAVVVFYRGAWCPYCNLTLRTYQQQLLPLLTARDVELVAISPQHPDGSLSMAEKNGLGFAVLSDPGNTLATTLGILTGPSDEARATQLQFGLDLTEINADGTTTVPMPTTVVLDADHLIRWIDVHPNYATRSEPHEILEAVDGTGV